MIMNNCCSQFCTGEKVSTTQTYFSELSFKWRLTVIASDFTHAFTTNSDFLKFSQWIVQAIVDGVSVHEVSEQMLVFYAT